MDSNVENATQDQTINAFHNVPCVILNITHNNGIWQGDNPFVEPLPLLITQLAFILIVTRSLYHLLRPLHQPRIISDILGGILLGPSAFGRTVWFGDLFPTRNIVTVETFAYMGLIFHIFLIGLELDQSVILRINRKAIGFTISGLVSPFAIGIGFFYLMQAFESHDQSSEANTQGSLLWSAALSVTSFPIVNKILSDLKLLNSDIGRLAMPIAFFSDMGCCFLIVVVIPFSENWATAPAVITTTLAYVLCCIFILRPILGRIIYYTSKGKDNHNFSQFYLCFFLVGVMLSAFITDAIGTHAIVGAFIFGLMMPKELALVLIEKFEFFVSGLMMPVFFAITGVRVDIFKVEEWKFVVVIVVVLCSVKVLSFLPISLVSSIEPKDCFFLGLLMNTKGVWAILIVHSGLDKGVLHEDDYAVMMVTLLLMTSLVAPTVAAIYKTNLPMEYKIRTIQDVKPDEELKILACIHSFHNVPGVLNLLDISHSTSRHDHVTVFTLQLVELIDYSSSAMLIVHDSSSHRFDYHPNYGDNHETDQIVNVFREFGKKNCNFTIQSLTAVSPFANMHRDICCLAEDKKVAFLILPFDKQAPTTTDENLKEEIMTAIHEINKNVLLETPCSVGIYVERGLGAKTSYGSYQIVLVFFGGDDDREALAYTWRMSKHPRVRLTVIRLLEIYYTGIRYSRKSSKRSLSSRSLSSQTLRSLSFTARLDRQRDIDDNCIDDFRLRTVGRENIEYREKTLQSEKQLLATLKEIETGFDLFVLGKRAGLHSPLTKGLASQVNCPELGVIGDRLVKSDSTMGSVLVVQQFITPENRLELEDFAAMPSPIIHRP